MLNICTRIEAFPKRDVVENRLKLPASKTSARELISEYVSQHREASTSKLVLITSHEAKMNNTLSSPKKMERYIKQAHDAFSKNGFILLVDDQQIETLDQEFTLRDESIVTFLRLTALVGG